MSFSLFKSISSLQYIFCLIHELSINLTFLSTHSDSFHCTKYPSAIKGKPQDKTNHSEMATLLCLVFFIFFKTILAEHCLQTLGNEKDYISALKNPGRIQKWNSAIKSFEFFEAVTSNGSKICTVNYSDDIRGQKIQVAVDAVIIILIKSYFKNFISKIEHLQPLILFLDSSVRIA